MKTKKELENFLFSKSAFILSEIENGDFVTGLMKRLGLDAPNYSHLFKIISKLEEARFLKSKMEGKTRVLTLLKKGEEVKCLIKEIRKKL